MLSNCYYVGSRRYRSGVAAILAFLLGNRIFPFVPDSELTDSEYRFNIRLLRRAVVDAGFTA